MFLATHTHTLLDKIGESEERKIETVLLKQTLSTTFPFPPVSLNRTEGLIETKRCIRHATCTRSLRIQRAAIVKPQVMVILPQN